VTAELVLTNARIVTADDIVEGTVALRDGIVTALDIGPSRVPGAVDCGGDYLLPGLVELHTDNLERHVAPRPGVRWPMPAAVLSHDSEIAAAGITTVLDALTVGDKQSEPLRAEMLHDAVAAIAATKSAGLLRAEHFLHLRCEVAHETVVETVEPMLDDRLLRLVSLMDHTPGQRQFASMESYRHYHQTKYGVSDADLEAQTAILIEGHRRYAADNRLKLSALCATRGLCKATHDDATLDHIEEAVGLGATIAEFPTTADAAGAARRHGMAVVMGAPNVVRGSSHSGNISARALAANGLLDILSSDYMPVSLLHGAFLLHRTMAMPLPEAVAKVSRNPALSIGLADRGEIRSGMRADLVRVRLVDDLPVSRQVWRAGERVA
jgi:alpha-D-ribose 1-methylphosphonate 5-triphosphate diphosphatase